MDEVAAAGTAAMDETFFGAQRRHRRTARLFTVLAALGAVLQGIPLALILSPIFIGVEVLVADVVNLWRPTPDLGREVYRSVLELAEATAVRVDTSGGGAADPEPGTLADAARAALDLFVLSAPGLSVMLVLWWLVRRFMLRDGLGGVLVAAGGRPPDHADAEEHQLVNVVAEMAIAAGIRPPRVLVLPAEVPNAAAFGRSPEAWTIAVSRGLLDDLDRDASQGVVAHLVGSVANGDLRMQHSVLALYAAHQLAQDLVAFPFARVSRERVRRAGRMLRGTATPVEEAETLRRLLSADFDKGSANVFLLANALSFKMAQFYTNCLVVGPLLTLPFRARRYLADATAVQLARSPDGLGRALAHLQEHRGDLPGARYAAIYAVTTPEPSIRELSTTDVSTADGGTDDPHDLVLPTSLHPPMRKRLDRLHRLGFRHMETPAEAWHRGSRAPFGKTWPAPLRWLALAGVWTLLAAVGLPLFGLFVLVVVAGIQLSVQLGMACWATVTAVVVVPLHLLLRALA
jgi:Zn-dependent protease with chaperone function